MKERRLTKKLIVGAFAMGFLVASGTAFLTLADSGKGYEDKFVIPSAYAKTAYVGQKTSLARIMPTDEVAKDYAYTVVYTATGEQVETDGYSFTPNKEGEYRCFYTYNAYGTTYEYTYSVDASVKNGPVFASEPYFPNAYVAGKKYDLPVMIATDYSSGTAVDAAVSVSVMQNGTSVAVDGNAFVPSADGAVEITYTATAGGKTETYQNAVPTVNVYNGTSVDMKQLFTTVGFLGVSADAESLTFNAMGDATAKFVNVLGANGLNLSFGFGEKKQAEGVEIRLESYYDPTVALSVRFQKGKQAEGEGYVELNGKTRTPFTYTANQRIALRFDESHKKFYGNDDMVLFDVTTDEQGGAFDGFKGGLVKFTYKLYGVYGESEFKTYSVNSQALTQKTRDMIEPTLFLENTGLQYFVGDKLTFKNMRAIDVIDPTAELTLSVLYNGKTPVTDENGRTLTSVSVKRDTVVSFLADKSGVYTMSFTVKDASGNINPRNLVKMIYVYDREAPTLNVEGSVKAEVSVGEKVVLPKITATDNDGTEGTVIQVNLVYPSFRILEQGESTTGTLENVELTFDRAGTYEVRILAFDTYGNYTVKSYQVVCK